MALGKATVTTSATLIIAANPMRQNLLLTNNSSVIDIYVGFDSSVTVSTGILLSALGNMEFTRNGGTQGYLGDIYGITASSSAEIRYWETVQ